MLRIEGMWGPRSRGDGEAAALDRLVPTDSVNRASLNSNIMPGVEGLGQSDRPAVAEHRKQPSE